MRRLEESTGEHVTFTKFHETYFHPGCVAEGVTFQRDSSSPRLTASRLVIEGSYLGLLHHYVPKMLAQGAQLTVPAGALGKLGGNAGQSHADKSQSSTTIGELDLPHARIEIATAKHGLLVFQFDELRFQSIAEGRPVRFHATLRNPTPEGDLRVDGQAGPFQNGHTADALLSGSYQFSNATFDPYPGVGGSFSSQAKFHGQVRALEVQGVLDSPDFSLDKVKHPVGLHNQFDAIVNATNGDVRLNRVQSHYAQTTITTTGTIASDVEHGGKISDLEMSSSSARIQDLLRLFVREEPPALNAPITLHAHVVLPNEHRPFLKRLRIEGDFVMPDAQPTKPETQKNIDLLSARARGQADKVEDDQEKDNKQGTHKLDAELQHVTANVKGQLAFREGTAHFSSLTFEVPGALSQLSGTYNLLNEKIDLKGTMHMETRLSHATTGIKSWLAKIIQPKTHKPGEPGADVGVSVRGTYSHPSFAVQPTAGGK